MQKYNTDGKINVLGVYEGITTYEIREYLNTKKGAKKIMCTYDSLAKVAGITGYNYFLLIVNYICCLSSMSLETRL